MLIISWNWIVRLFFPHHFWIRHVPKYKFTNFNTNDLSHSDFMYINPYYCCFPRVHPFAFISFIVIVILKDCPEIELIFFNLKFEYLLNCWSDLSDINCNGFSFKSPLIWYTSFNQRHRAIFGCCIATESTQSVLCQEQLKQSHRGLQSYKTVNTDRFYSYQQ